MILFITERYYLSINGNNNKEIEEKIQTINNKHNKC